MKEKISNNELDSELTNISEKITYKIKGIIREDKKELLNENKKNDKIKKHTEIRNKKFWRWDKKGFTHIFLVDKDNNPLITIGPHWLLFLCCTLFVTGGFLFLFIYYYKFLNNYLFISGILVLFIFLYIYTYIFLTNPGFPKKIDENMVNKSKEKYMFCRICENWVTIESKTRHCSQCNICVEGHDHHCSWTSKCIGKNNVYYFYFLIFWIIVIIIYYTFAFLIAHEKWFEYKKYYIQKLRMKNKNL